jgi:hypothetical protein
MDQTHIHLVITHLPIIGSLLGVLVLGYSIWIKSNETKIAAYGIFILSSLGAGIAYLTGEEAEESVEEIAGVFHDTIERHEDFAQFALIALILLGVASLAAILLTIKKSPKSRSIAFGIFFLALFAFGMAARTGYLGGQIRHSEIVDGSSGSVPSQGEHEDD